MKNLLLKMMYNRCSQTVSAKPFKIYCNIKFVFKVPQYQHFENLQFFSYLEYFMAGNKIKIKGELINNIKLYCQMLLADTV